MILESIVTSVDRAGRVNLAPMGPIVIGDLTSTDDASIGFQLRPFVDSTTFRNLEATRVGVIHVTDDAMLFARAAVNDIGDAEVLGMVRPIDDSLWWPMVDCHRWFCVEIDSLSHDEVRSEMQCRVVRSKIVRPFFGFNRAKHAVIEAAILATRTHLIPADQIRDEIARLTPLIDKTAGPAEHAAFDLLRRKIDERLSRS